MYKTLTFPRLTSLCLSSLAALFLSLVFLSGTPLSGASAKPNIVYILTDDLGYGDVHCLNPKMGKIATPRMDQLAREGMTFTDAHASSSVCTPTRYSILTGRYNWRTRLQSEVLMGFDPPLIDPDRLTVAGLLKQQGYHTACIGKWHLGLGMPTRDGKPLDEEGMTNVDWKGRITGGPIALGFDKFFGISSSLNIAPYIYIQGDRFVGECTVLQGKGRAGPKEPSFDDVQTLPVLTKKTIDFIKRQDASHPVFRVRPPHLSAYAHRPDQGMARPQRNWRLWRFSSCRPTPPLVKSWMRSTRPAWEKTPSWSSPATTAFPSGLARKS